MSPFDPINQPRRRRAPLVPLAALVLAIARPAAAQSVAFVNVTVVPMDSARTLADQTVLVDSGRIVQIGASAQVAPKPGSLVIDGRGRWLMPGLADMHIHLFADSNELPLYLARGVTTVRELSGSATELRWRQEIADGRRTGPNLIVASPLIDSPRGARRVFAWRWGVAMAFALAAMLVALVATRHIGRGRRRAVTLATGVVAMGAGYAGARWLVPLPDALLPASTTPHMYVGNPREAAAAARQAAAGGYHLVKLYDRLSAAEFGAAVRAAREARIRSIVHVPLTMRLERALAAGPDELAHTYFLVVELLASTDTAALPAGAERDSAYARRLREIATLVARSGTGVTTTLMPLPELRELWTDSLAFLARQDLMYRTPATRDTIQALMRRGATPAQLREIDMHIRWGSVAARDLAEAGVPLVLGTDNSPITAVAGFGSHEEIAQLLEAGLTPWQVLSAATTNASLAAGGAVQWGRVAVGLRADLVLSSANPLDDPATLRQPLGVMVRGRWYDRATLDSLVAAVVRRRAS